MERLRCQLALSADADNGGGHAIAVRVNADHMIEEFCQNNHLSHLFLVMIFTAGGNEARL
jgi:hypothetical protein